MTKTLKRLSITWDGDKWGDVEAGSMIEHLKWVIEKLENPPDEYIVMEFDPTHAEIKLRGLPLDPLGEEVQAAGRFMLSKGKVNVQ